MFVLLPMLAHSGRRLMTLLPGQRLPLPGRPPNSGRLPSPGRSPIPGRFPGRPGRSPGRAMPGSVVGRSGRSPIPGRFGRSPSRTFPGSVVGRPGRSAPPGRSGRSSPKKSPTLPGVGLGAGRLVPGRLTPGRLAPGRVVSGRFGRAGRFPPAPGRLPTPGRLLGGREGRLGKLALGRPPGRPMLVPPPGGEGRLGRTPGRVTLGRVDGFNPPEGKPPVGRLTEGRLGAVGRVTFGRLTLGGLILGRLTLGRLTLGRGAGLAAGRGALIEGRENPPPPPIRAPPPPIRPPPPPIRPPPPRPMARHSAGTISSRAMIIAAARANFIVRLPAMATLRQRDGLAPRSPARPRALGRRQSFPLSCRSAEYRRRRG